MSFFFLLVTAHAELLDIVMDLIDMQPLATRGAGYLLARNLTYSIPRHVLRGRWDGNYGDGTAPWVVCLGLCIIYMCEDDEDVSWVLLFLMYTPLLLHSLLRSGRVQETFSSCGSRVGTRRSSMASAGYFRVSHAPFCALWEYHVDPSPTLTRRMIVALTMGSLR